LDKRDKRAKYEGKVKGKKQPEKKKDNTCPRCDGKKKKWYGRMEEGKKVLENCTLCGGSGTH